ncbi:MAG: hypothetical protein M3R69_09460 [Acidobacteriota bacterium]|nr:hypothetical protein [Acidobacteriota bacterium]
MKGDNKGEAFENSSGLPSVAAGPGTDNRALGVVPTTFAGGVARSLAGVVSEPGRLAGGLDGLGAGAGITMRGRISGFGFGVCAWLLVNAIAMTSNDAAREVLFIG